MVLGRILKRVHSVTKTNVSENQRAFSSGEYTSGLLINGSLDVQIDKIGNVVTITILASTYTTQVGGFFGIASVALPVIPVHLRPLSEKNCICIISSESVQYLGKVVVKTSGFVELFFIDGNNLVSPHGFVPGTVFSYTLM